MRYLSIDISNHTIKIADLVNRNNKITVKHSITIPIEPNQVEDGSIRAKANLVNTIKMALNESGIKTKNAIFTLYSSRIITREILIPHTNKKKTQSIIELNANDYFPVNISDYIIDYKTIDIVKEEKNKKQKIFLLAAPRALVMEYIALAEGIGLKLKAIDYAGSGIFEMLSLQKHKGVNLYIELNRQSTIVTILNNNQLELQKYIPQGVDEVYKAVQEYLEMDYETAIRKIQKQSFLNTDMDMNPYMKDDITSSINTIMSNISRLMDYFSSRHSKLSINEIFITGCGSQIYGIQQYIEKFFDIKVNKLEEYANVSAKNIKGFDEKWLHFTAIFGTALSKVNFIPKEILLQYNSHKRKRLAVELVILSALISLSGIMVPMNDKNKLEKQKEQLLQQIDDLKSIEDIINEHGILEEQLNFREEMIFLSQNSSEDFLEILKAFEQHMPTQLYYTSMTHQNNTLSINGYATDQLTIAAYIEQIKGMPYFSDIHVSSINLEEIESNNEVRYRFNAVLEYQSRE
ncbi:type IV pilus assembly protein PilM [Natranaerovirga hydrolytica]|uniref:Type IV pilus assembly protein PilM n=1 Tax=Natranaerovirga hydrolytica TaxID=680378 RepID=A0A4R1MYQ9_9FIRM|nr:pilus assembly protein PilM [Natranaerovirga hydrolytica]TCK98376.1 type IV pilus assembly protein PilM [Natranaerovirga hydrolytica]